MAVYCCDKVLGQAQVLSYVSDERPFRHIATGLGLGFCDVHVGPRGHRQIFYFFFFPLHSKFPHKHLWALRDPGFLTSFLIVVEHGQGFW